MHVYGNYCGPNWSDGKVQPSVASGGPSIDEIDEVCRIHDRCYNQTFDRKRCDKHFSRAMLKLGTPLSLAMALAVGTQGLMRSHDNIYKYIKEHVEPKMPKPIRGNIVAYRTTNTPTQTPAAKKNNQVMLLPAPKQNQNSNQKSVQMSLPAAYVLHENVRAPKISNRNGMTVLTHKGLVGVVIGSTTFSAVKYVCNPGIANSFPWCSRLAKSFDKYRFKKLRYCYRPIANTTVGGTVMMAFDYDTLDALPTSKFEAAQTFPNSETSVFAKTELIVKPDKNWRFIRQGDISSVDYKTYDFGNIVISTTYSAAQVVGELYVEYEVELDKPSLGKPISVVAIGTGGKTNLFNTVSYSGSAQPFSATNPSTGLKSANVLYCCVPGEYYIDVYSIGTVLSDLAIVLTGLGSVAFRPSNGTSVYSAAQLEMKSSFEVKASYGDYITLTYTATTVTSCVVTISEGEYL